jgi:hypothetical protein
MRKRQRRRSINDVPIRYEEMSKLFSEKEKGISSNRDIISE